MRWPPPPRPSATPPATPPATRSSPTTSGFVLHFAYGSNLSSLRLRQPERAPAAEVLGPAELAGHALAFSKRGRDGSGKCTLVPAGPGERVHGALLRLTRAEKAALDRSEGLGEHYLERLVEVRAGAGRFEAWTYVAAPGYVAEGLRPFDWYLGLVVAGAREHGLPADWVRRLEAVARDADPDVRRARLARGGVPPERLG